MSNDFLAHSDPNDSLIVADVAGDIAGYEQRDDRQQPAKTVVAEGRDLRLGRSTLPTASAIRREAGPITSPPTSSGQGALSTGSTATT
jgi:hypothetical protein